MPQSPDAPKRLPLVVTPDNRDDSTSKDARLVNCYLEKGLSEGDYHIYKRPGTLAQSNPPGASAAGQGSYNWQGDIYTIFGGTFYKNGISKGTVDATGGVYAWSQSLGTPARLVLGNGVNAYTWDGTSLLQIQTAGATITAGSFVVGVTYTIVTVGDTDFTAIGATANTIGISFVATGVGTGDGTASEAAFPSPFVKGFAFLDETTYVMNAQAEIQGSNLNDPTYWDPLNSLTAQIEPDGGVALSKQLAYVIAQKQWSTEVFFDQANATGSPLGTVQGAKVNYGCVSADSLQDIDGTLLWICSNRSAAPQVIMMDALKGEIISTKAIDRLLAGADFTTVYSLQYKGDGHKFYIVTIKNANLTLVFDLVERAWSQWIDVNGNYFPFVSSTYTTNLQHLFQHETNGYMYYASPLYNNDNGSIITIDIYTPNYDGDIHQRKVLDRMDFIGDKTPGSTLNVRFSDNDYQSWSNYRQVDMNQTTPFLTRMGTFRRRAFNLRHQSNTDFRLMAIELTMRIGVL